VQQQVERALAEIAGGPVRVHCAGRTDTGVHAVAQWVHFDAPVARSIKAWIVGGNAQLPPDVRLADGLAVADDFHARHSARSRRYDYLIANTQVAPALLSHRALWFRDPLDVPRMHGALQALLGEHDFSAFRAAACQSTTPMRHVSQVAVWRPAPGFVQLRITANAFLHHMVRNIVGSALETGRGRRSAAWLRELLDGGDRTRAAATAPPQGLYLSEVSYPRHHAIPAAPPPPFLDAAPPD
jgi:tRNA pseudouridine38-40 synthase